MRYGELLKEASTLGALGVDRKGIRSIHKNLTLKHDAEFEPISNKSEAKEAIKKGKVIIAVNGEGNSWGFGMYAQPMSGGIDVIFGMTDKPETWETVASLTKALAKVKGKGWKYYVSTSGTRQHDDKSDRIDRNMSPRDENADATVFINRVAKVYGKLIKSDAKKGHTQVRRHLMKLMDKPDAKKSSWGNYVPSHEDMNQVKHSMDALKKLATNGLDSWNAQKDHGDRGEMGALGDFFPGTMYYSLNRAVGEFQTDEKLAMAKFVKYLRKDIFNIISRAKTGQHDENPQNARDYKDARDEKRAEDEVAADKKEASKKKRSDKAKAKRAADKKK